MKPPTIYNCISTRLLSHLEFLKRKPLGGDSWQVPGRGGPKTEKLILCGPKKTLII